MKLKTIIGIIDFSPDRKANIILRHPVMEDDLINLRMVLEKPDEIRFSNYSNDTLLFYRYFDNIESGKYIVVVVNQAQKEVRTAYLSHRIKIGRKYEEKK